MFLPTISATDDVLLWGFSTVDDFPDSVRAILFGEMLKRSVTEHYLSDYFHDATWIAANVSGPTSFPWVTRECGSDIGSGDWMNATYHNRSRTSPFDAYMVTVYHDATSDRSDSTGAWRARFDRVSD